MADSGISFPRQYARTVGFSLGVPHAFAIAPDGNRVAFLRTRSGTDRSTALWVLDAATGAERLVADPEDLLSGREEILPPEERARRERTRQAAAGVVSFAADEAVRIAAFALSGRLFVADLADPDGAPVRELVVPGPVLDPRPDPTGAHIGYVVEGALRVVAADGAGDRAVAVPEAANVTYGLAEFLAAEEMYRTRGFWWSPDGRRLLVARVDTTPAADCRVRSRRARSTGGTISSRPDRSSSGSATSRSAPVAASRTHRAVLRSVPERDRRNATRLSSGAIANACGTPRKNPTVRAYWRGKLVLASVMVVVRVVQIALGSF